MSKRFYLMSLHINPYLLLRIILIAGSSDFWEFNSAICILITKIVNQIPASTFKKKSLTFYLFIANIFKGKKKNKT